MTYFLHVQRYPEFYSSPLLTAFRSLPVRAKNGVAVLPCMYKLTVCIAWYQAARSKLFAYTNLGLFPTHNFSLTE